MMCLKCGSDIKYIRKSKKETTEKNHNVTKKRYRCPNCGAEYDTTERVVTTPVIIITNKNGYTVFSKTKYQNSILKILQDLPNAMEVAKSIVYCWYMYVEKTREMLHGDNEGYDYLDYEFTIDELIEFTVNSLVNRKLIDPASRYLALCFSSIEDESVYKNLLVKTNAL